MFDSDIYNIAQLLLASFLRKQKVTAWIKVLTSGVKSLMATFTAYRADTLFLIAHNSQVIYLEHYLNAKFNPAANTNDPDYTGTGIYITDAVPATETFLYNGNEHVTDTYLYNAAEAGPDTYLYNASEFANRIGFAIHVPASFNVSISEIMGVVNRLRLAGKQFTIKTYVI